MAIYVVFRKTSEDAMGVSYEFGGADHRFDRALKISSADYSVAVEDGQGDNMTVRVAGMAIRGHRADGVWPKAGIHQA
ncbi:hypothetical protein [Nocardia salmonicida]|uniref:hypothetical protein n=1 Tax=Nocardia salmonicida TaxID=53431 RepID=UPI000AC3F00C|nr:hypothetical protein [Nocardia salmonicida]